MTTKIMAALAVACGCAVIAAAAAARDTRSTSCSSNEGAVLSYIPTAGRQCGLVVVGATLFRAETVHTASAGGFTFHTNHLSSCRESPASSDTIFPSSSVAILHLTGTTWCIHRAGNSKQYLTARNAKILTTGTVVGMAYSRSGLTVKLDDGSALVTPKGSTRAIVVPSGRQLFVPFTGRATKPTPLQLTADDQVAVVELRENALGTSLKVLPGALAPTHDRTAVLIGDTQATLDALQKALPRVKTAEFTFDQVNQDPTQVATALKELQTHVLLTAGPLEDATAGWDTLRTLSLVPDDVSLFYVE